MCKCEDYPCCGCDDDGVMVSDREDRYDDEDDFVDRLMTDDDFYDRVVGWF